MAPLFLLDNREFAGMATDFTRIYIIKVNTVRDIQLVFGLHIPNIRAVGQIRRIVFQPVDQLALHIEYTDRASGRQIDEMQLTGATAPSCSPQYMDWVPHGCPQGCASPLLHRLRPS
jgi:hypothetical protein